MDLRLALVAFLVPAFERPVHAYLDAGRDSFLLQVAVARALGPWFCLERQTQPLFSMAWRGSARLEAEPATDQKHDHGRA